MTTLHNAYQLADTLAVDLNRPVNRLLLSSDVAKGVLYAFSIKDHSAVVLLYLGSDGFYCKFVCTRNQDWEEEFFHLWFNLEYGEIAREPVIPENYMDTYGRQIECPEFRKMGLRIFTTCLTGKQVWTVYSWPRKWVLPKYGVGAQHEIVSADEKDGLLKLMLGLYEAHPLLSHFRWVVNVVIYRLQREVGNV